MASKSAGICVQDLDKKFFNYLYENKVAMVEQINRDVYRYDRMNSLYFRLSRLSDIGLIEMYRSPYLKTKNIFSLTPKALKEFICPTETSRAELKSAKVLHDLDLVDARYYLTNLVQVKNYYTENLLISGMGILNDENLLSFEAIRPDAVIELEFLNGSFFLTLEYEANLKYYSRYRELFRKYYAEKGIGGVLYLCKTPEILERVSSYEKKFLSEERYEKAKFYYSTFEELKAETKPGFKNVQNKKFVLERRKLVSNPTQISLH